MCNEIATLQRILYEREKKNSVNHQLRNSYVSSYNNNHNKESKYKSSAELLEIVLGYLQTYGIVFLSQKHSDYSLPENKHLKIVRGYCYEVIKVQNNPCKMLESVSKFNLSVPLWLYCHARMKSSGVICISERMHTELLELATCLMEDQGISPTNFAAEKAKRKRKHTISKPTKLKVWVNQFGNAGVGLCPVCKTNEISPFTFHCGHKISEKNGGPAHAVNLIALCATCNLSMGSMNYDDFIITHNF